MLVYDTSEWKERTSFSTGEGTVPCKICYLAERKGKETSWFLLVSCARENEDLGCKAVMFYLHILLDVSLCGMR